MLSTNITLFFLGLLLIAVLLEPLANRFRIPFAIILVSIGFIGSEVTTNYFEIDTGIRWDNFQPIISYLILPILLFLSALKINSNKLLDNIVTILMMALPLMLLATLLTAAIIYYGIGHPTGFPWIAALIAGAILSATDPASVLELLKRFNVSERLGVLLEGESLFNDATAIVLFGILISIALNTSEMTSWSAFTFRFTEVFFGGLLLGVVFGLVFSFLIKLFSNQQAIIVLSIINAYSVFIITKDFFGYSGVMAVLSSGIIISVINREKLKPESFFRQFWKLIGKIARAMIYILGGITITLAMFTDQWLAMLIGIVAVVTTRFVTIMGLFPFISLLPTVDKISMKERAILVWAGDRGTITLALALSLPLTLDYYYTIQSIAYGVVVFTLLVQAATMPKIVKSLTR